MADEQQGGGISTIWRIVIGAIFLLAFMAMGKETMRQQDDIQTLTQRVQKLEQARKKKATKKATKKAPKKATKKATKKDD